MAVCCNNFERECSGKLAVIVVVVAAAAAAAAAVAAAAAAAVVAAAAAVVEAALAAVVVAAAAAHTPHYNLAQSIDQRIVDNAAAVLAAAGQASILGHPDYTMHHSY